MYANISIQKLNACRIQFKKYHCLHPRNSSYASFQLLSTSQDSHYPDLWQHRLILPSSVLYVSEIIQYILFASGFLGSTFCSWDWFLLQVELKTVPSHSCTLYFYIPLTMGLQVISRNLLLWKVMQSTSFFEEALIDFTFILLLLFF